MALNKSSQQAKKTTSRSKPKEREHDLQVSCVQWFRLAKRKEMIFAIPNGGQRHIAVARKMKAEGVLPGVPDLFIPAPTDKYAGLFIELKVGKNKPTPAQVKIMQDLSEKGYLSVVCYTFEQFVDAVTKYFGNSI